MNALLIAKRDLAAYLHGFGGMAIISTMLFIDGLLFQVFVIGTGEKYSHEILEQFFYMSSGVVMIASVLITMRAIAEERQTGTDVLLHTSPVSEWQIVVGKYLAAMGMLTLLTLLTAYMPALIFVNGKVSYAHIATGYLGLLSLGSATTAIGIFGSSLFRNQFGAAIVSGVIVVSMLLCWLLSELVSAPFTDVVAYMALFDKHFMPFMEGRLLSTGLTFYASVTFVFLMLSSRMLEGRRWQ